MEGDYNALVAAVVAHADLQWALAFDRGKFEIRYNVADFQGHRVFAP
jgi:hypothetical protein